MNSTLRHLCRRPVRIVSLFSVVGVSTIVGALLFELTIGLYSYRVPQFSALDQIQARQNWLDSVGATGRRIWDDNLAVHPLFGYVYQPGSGINHFGFRTPYRFHLGPHGLQVQGSPPGDTYVVGVFGGSFADITATFQRDYLENRLGEKLGGKKIALVNFSIGGHSLPQSLAIFLYFRDALNAAVFLDGANEVINPLVNNRGGYPPDFAKAAHFSYLLSQPAMTEELFDGTKQLQSLTKFSLRPWIRHSHILHAWWEFRIGRYLKKIRGEAAQVATKFRKPQPFFADTEQAILAHAVSQWKKQHALIDEIGTARNMEVIHLLQPNPFVKKSKPLSQRERRILEGEGSELKQSLSNAYPYLSRAFQRLKDTKAIRGEDLSYLFQRETRDIWDDGWHANELGSRRVADRIIALVSGNPRLAKAH